MTAKLKAEIRRLKAEIAMLKPASGPGMLTNRTSRGVTRKPTARAAAVEERTQEIVPVWG